MNLETLRRVAAEIAAAAVFETYPNVELVGGRETSTGFYYDLYFPHVVHPELLSLIEEKMRQIIREKRPIRTLEMVPVSARGFLQKEGHSSRAEDLEDVEDELVTLIQMGSFVDLCPGPHLKNTAEVAAFKIFSIEPIGDRVFRIVGTAHRSKDDLKVFLKKLEIYSKKNHLRLGKERGFWTEREEGMIWEEKGLEEKQKLLEFLKKNLFVDTREIAGPLGSDRVALHCAIGKEKIPLKLAEVWRASNESEDPDLGFFEAADETQIQITTFPEPQLFSQSLISSLQLIGKTLTILGFDYSLCLYGRGPLLKDLEKVDWGMKVDVQETSLLRVEFLIEDLLDRGWPAVQVKGVSAKKPIAFVVNISLERVFALLLEKDLLSKW